MNDTKAEGSLAIWTTPQCPFAIEYVPRVLDDIRLAVVDAFYSLPRGGAEIGGILTGNHTGGHIAITGYQPLECEHAFGPSFQLSGNDHTRLAELIADARSRGEGVVGWYHSHTRSEIFLSDTDVEIHNRYFAEPWQVALVMKPSTFSPARCGFFFREADGSIHRTETYQEFTLEGVTVRPAPLRPERVEHASPVAPPLSESASRRPLRTVDVEAAVEAPPRPVPAVPPPPTERVEPAAPVAPPLPESAPRRPLRTVEVEATVEPAPRPVPVVPPPAPEPPPPPPPPPPELPRVISIAREEILPEPAAPEAEEPEPPAFATIDSAPKRPLAWLYWLVAACAVMTIAYAYRDKWAGSTARPAEAATVQKPAVERTPKPSALDTRPAPAEVKPAAPAAPPAPLVPVALTAADHDGQLQIRWERNSPLVQEGTRGTLVIDDGGTKQSVPLDAAHLHAGAFDYGRQSGRVDLQLVIENAAGGKTLEVGGYLGQPRPTAPKVVTEQLQKERDALAKELAKVKADLVAQTDRARKAEKARDDLQRQIKADQLKRRMGNQAGSADRSSASRPRRPAPFDPLQ